RRACRRSRAGTGRWRRWRMRSVPPAGGDEQPGGPTRWGGRDMSRPRGSDGQATPPSRSFAPRPHLRRIRVRGQEAEYLDVKWRLAWLRTEHPDARITTEHVTL